MDSYMYLHTTGNQPTDVLTKRHSHCKILGDFEINPSNLVLIFSIFDHCLDIYSYVSLITGI